MGSIRSSIVSKFPIGFSEMNYYQDRGKYDLPMDCPNIPIQVSMDSLVAIITLHHPDAFIANRDTIFQKTLVKDIDTETQQLQVFGCHIYLHHLAGRPVYEFGRPTVRDKADALDVYLPNTSVALKQLILVPSREAGCWRVEATSETAITVNAVPLQKYSFRTMKKKANLPHALYLDESRANHVSVPGMQIDIWIIKKAVDILKLEPGFLSTPLLKELQDMNNRAEGWAQSQYILSQNAEQVSNKSYRVLQRFAGTTETAKVFCRDSGVIDRDREFSLFYKKQVHSSIVQYKAKTTFNGVPAVITETHQGMTSYGAMQAHLKGDHPGLRFRVAASILRPLFSALEFLHFHRIIHGSVSWDSVLLRFVDDRVQKVLLVDYSETISVPPWKDMPRNDMIQDSQQAMELIEDCCGIWALRQDAAPNARSEEYMRLRTENAEKSYTMAQRVCAYYFDKKGVDRQSQKGMDYLAVLANKEMEWSRARTDQLHNAGLRQISPVSFNKLTAIKQKWEESAKKLKRTKYFPMVLTLGHKYLDDLANSLFRSRWEFFPRDICGKLRSLEGTVEKPWRTFSVHRVFDFEITSTRKTRNAPLRVHIGVQSFMHYLVACCEIYPECRREIVLAFDKDIVVEDGFVHKDGLRTFRNALSRDCAIPESMRSTLRDLGTTTMPDLEKLPGTEFHRKISITEVHEVSTHVPSGMFNVTQLHRLATPEQLHDCLIHNSIWCDNFTEVRGESRIQGHYVSLSMLPTFASALGITIQEIPSNERSYPVVDPSDFSQVSHGRIVLAHTSLVAFASVPRDGNQFSHLPETPTEISNGDPFLSTYFGDIKVLPNVPGGSFHHPRPEHWVKFKSVEEAEEEAKLINRATHIYNQTMHIPTEPLRKPSSLRRVISQGSLTEALETYLTIDELHVSDLEKLLISRTNIIAQVSTPAPKQNIQDMGSEDELVPNAKRARLVDFSNHRENMGLTSSFLKRNPNLLRSPPRRGLDPTQSFKPYDRTKPDRHQRKYERMRMKEWADNLTESSATSESESEKTDTNTPRPRYDRNAEDTMDCAREDDIGSLTEVATAVQDEVYHQSILVEAGQLQANKTIYPGEAWLKARGQFGQQNADMMYSAGEHELGSLPVGASFRHLDGAEQMADRTVAESEDTEMGGYRVTESVEFGIGESEEY